MHFKTTLSDKTFQEKDTKISYEDTFNGFFIESKRVLENAGFKLSEDHEKDGVKIEDFEDSEKNELRLVNGHFLIYKKDKSHVFNWSCDLKDVVQNIIKQEDNPIAIRYYFNFPVGRFSDKGVYDILQTKGVEPITVLNNNIQNDDFLKEQFFNTNKSLDNVIQNICEPMNSNFTKMDLIDIGYLKSSRENSFFIEENNHYFQNHELPNVIYFDEHENVSGKKFEKNNPKGHLILVNIEKGTIEHSPNKIGENKDFAIFITYKENQFNVEKKQAILMLKPKQKHIRKMLPLMGYPNGYCFDDNKFLWFIGKDPEDMQDITESVQALTGGQEPSSFNDPQRAFFNYHFKIGSDNDMFEDMLECVENSDFKSLNPDEFMFIETCLEGEHVYRDAFEQFKDLIEKQKAS